MVILISLRNLSISLESIWATACQNQQNDLCTQQRLRSAWASALSDQSLLCALRIASSCRQQRLWSGRMPRLIWVFTGHTGHFVGFVMLRLIYKKQEHDNYRKIPNYLDTRNCCNYPKIWKIWLYHTVHRITSPKDADRWQTVKTLIRRSILI